MKRKMKTILIPSIIVGFVLMLINVALASEQQQAVPAAKAAVKKMETQVQTMPTSQPQAEKSVTQSQKTASSMMKSSGNKAMMSNHEIKLMQEALNKDGYKLKVDGILGMHTSNAIKNFQKKNDLTVTGQPDSMTLAKLNLK
jgi:peptidoglycan hydrolase-like protein with peptidoglycan-binding domain